MPKGLRSRTKANHPTLYGQVKRLAGTGLLRRDEVELYTDHVKCFCSNELPYCDNGKTEKDRLKDGTVIQGYRCRTCDKRFNERTGTPMATYSQEYGGDRLKMRTEGTAIRSTGRILENRTHSYSMGEACSKHCVCWSPPAPSG